jgi:dTDP-4-amino-4,6-dideoxygalactose transaminase
MTAIKKIADKHKLRVIEDNAQAIGAAGLNFKIAQLSDAATTSFIIQKNLGTFGDSGALVTNNAELDARIRKLRNHGSTQRNVHSYGFNSRLDDLHAGVLSAKLKHIDAWNDNRRKWAARYTAGLKSCKTIDICPLSCQDTATCSTCMWWKPRSPNGATNWWISWWPTALTPRPTTRSRFTSSRIIHGGGRRAWLVRCPMLKPTAACCVSLPMFPELKPEEVDYVVEKVKEWDAKFASQAPEGKGLARAGQNLRLVTISKKTL